MASQISLPYQFPPIDLISPQANGSAITTQVYASMRNALKAWIVVKVAQGNAATVAITPVQATSSSGAGSKAIGGADTAAPIWLNDDTSLATGGDAFAAQAPALSFTTDATVKNKIVIFELAPEAVLDIPNGFNHIGLNIGASNAANIVTATLHIYGSYEGASVPSSYV